MARKTRDAIVTCVRCRDIDPVEDTERRDQLRCWLESSWVAGISIRLRILKGPLVSAKRSRVFGCRDIDPVEDTESTSHAPEEYLQWRCRDIDPVEDTESFKGPIAYRLSTGKVAGISIRLRILKACVWLATTWRECSGCRDIDPVEDTESDDGEGGAFSVEVLLQGYRSG